MAKPLNERIQNALSNDRVRSTDLQALIAEAREAREAASGVMTQATEDSINLGLGDEDRDAAAHRADRARRDILAFGLALESLEGRLAARVASEQQQEKEDRRARLLAERDRIADELRAQWPGIEASIVSLLSAVVGNEAEMKAAGIREANAEAIARGVPGNFAKGGISIRQLTKIALPAFLGGHDLAWPPQARAAHSWIDQVAETRARQIEAHKRQADAERAAWAEHMVSAGNITSLAEVKGRAGPDGADVKFTLYPRSLPGNDRFEGGPRKVWIHANEAAWLRRIGAQVEAVT